MIETGFLLQLLLDKSRLQEIYDLRVEAWENSDRAGSISKAEYPNGWSEEIDKDAFHFVIFDTNNKIIASARISLHQKLDELRYPETFKDFKLPSNRPFAFYSRLVVSPKYRSSFSFKKLDLSRITFLKENKIPFAIATCKDERLKSMIRIGFEVLGKTNVPYAEIGEETALILFLENVKLNGGGQ